jgi:hypothetical protein
MPQYENYLDSEPEFNYIAYRLSTQPGHIKDLAV